MKQVKFPLTSIQYFLSQRQSGNLHSQSEPNLKRENVNVVMTRSKRTQEDSQEKEGSFPKPADDVLNEKD